MTLLKKLTIGTAMTAMALAGANGAQAMDDMKMDGDGAMMNSTNDRADHDADARFGHRAKLLRGSRRLRQRDGRHDR